MTSERLTDAMERRLREWGTWLAAGCSTTGGYPTKSVLHPEWSPPASGSRPAMKVATVRDVREREVHALVCGMSHRMQQTLIAQYVLNLTAAERAERLGCGPSTVRVRVMNAKRELAASLRSDEAVAPAVGAMRRGFLS
jgi:DNA-directed RNA polymerase specialized sigma24 family protein